MHDAALRDNRILNRKMDLIRNRKGVCENPKYLFTIGKSFVVFKWYKGKENVSSEYSTLSGNWQN